MNLTDLKQTLDERSDGSTAQVKHHLRLRGVRAKVVARRRRRIATWATAVVVALVATAVAVPGLRPDVTPTPAVTPTPGVTSSPSTVMGFPEYAVGSHVVSATSAALSERRIELTMVPTTLDLVVFMRCDGVADDLMVDGKLTVNGKHVAEGSCNGTLRPADWAEKGVVVGKPATFVGTITGAQRSGDAGSVSVPVPENGTVALAIGERIPFDQYPLPPRPAGPLGPLDHTLPAGCTEALCPNVVIIRSDPADPTRPVRQTLAWRTLTSIDMIAQTPGLLHLRVGGVEVGTGEWWDYEMAGYGTYGDEGGEWKREYGLDLSPGDQVTVEVVPEHITGAWQVVFTPVPGSAGG
ncbi:hypothetical protein [Micromonospora craterilacus]|uniref:hypothetical protein n=1 Tax=Micromonospora craterilacus TaxID=1655439 RepID=UPI00131471A5|nr:hypothetical protein [Micromonospora craterilacus]